MFLVKNESSKWFSNEFVYLGVLASRLQENFEARCVEDTLFGFLKIHVNSLWLTPVVLCEYHYHEISTICISFVSFKIWVIWFVAWYFKKDFDNFHGLANTHIICTSKSDSSVRQRLFMKVAIKFFIGRPSLILLMKYEQYKFGLNPCQYISFFLLSG